MDDVCTEKLVSRDGPENTSIVDQDNSPNNSVILSLDKLVFSEPHTRTMYAYLVGITADSSGNVQIVDTPSSTHIRHRPRHGRPFSWPLAFDGFTFYQCTGGLPDWVMFSLMIVRDRRVVRQAGEVLRRIGQSHALEELMTDIGGVAASPEAGGDTKGQKGKEAEANERKHQLVGKAVGDVTRLVPSVVNLISSELEHVHDKLLDTIDGSLPFTPENWAKSEISSAVTGTIATATFDFHLFDAATDEASKDGLDITRKQLAKRGLLVGSNEVG